MPHCILIAKLTIRVSPAASRDIVLHFQIGNYLSLLSKSYTATWIALNLCGRMKMKNLSQPALMCDHACGLLRQFILLDNRSAFLLHINKSISSHVILRQFSHNVDTTPFDQNTQVVYDVIACRV